MPSGTAMMIDTALVSNIVWMLVTVRNVSRVSAKNAATTTSAAIRPYRMATSVNPR